MNEKLPTEDILTVALVVRWTVQAVEMAAVLSGERQWCVIEADCLHVLPWLPDKSVGHVLQDPPYEAEAHTKFRTTRAVKEGRMSDAAIDFAPITTDLRAEVSAEGVRIGRGWLLAFCQVEAVGAWRSVLEAAGATWGRGQVWVKPDSSPQFTGDRPAQGFECIATAWCGEGRMSWNGGGRRGVYQHCINSGDGNDHPTQKPDKLMLDLVRLFTDPGEVILDCFAGSGTTGVAALRLGRRAILIERDPKYAAIARQRMEAEERGQSLKEYRAGQRTLWEA